MALGTEVGDAYISIHADTTPFRADLARLNRVLGNATNKNNDYAQSLERVNAATKRHNKLNRDNTETIRRLGNEHTRTARKVDNSRGVFEKFADNVSNRWRRMDSTVRLVLGLILAAGPQMATLGSVLSSSLTAVAAAAAGAIIALAPLAGLVGPLVGSFAGLALIFKELGDEWSDFTDALKNNAMEGLFERVSGAVGDLFDTLLTLMDTDFFRGIGEGLEEIIRTLDEVLGSESAKNAFKAFAGPLMDAFTTIVTTLTGPLLTAFFDFVSATAPVAQQLADMFADWGIEVRDTIAALSESGELQAFFEAMIDPLKAVLDLFGAVKDVLITVFKAAVGPGTQFLNIIVNLLNQWNEWMKSVEGQKALQEFFDNLFAVLPSLFELLGAAGKAIADLVTPQAVKATTGLLQALADIMPILSDVLALLSEAGVIDVLAAALAALGEVVTPLVRPLGDFLALLSGQLIRILETLAPEFTAIGEAIGSILPSLAPLLPALANLIIMLVQSLVPVLPVFAQVITQVLDAIVPLVSEILAGLMPILPALADALIAAANVISQVLVVAVQLLTPLIEGLIPVFDDIAELLIALIPLFEAMTDGFVVAAPIINLLSKGLANFASLIVWIIDLVVDVTKFIIDWAMRVQDLAIAIINFVKYNPLTTFLRTLVNEGTKNWNAFVNAAKNALGALPQIFKVIFNQIASLWNNTVGKLGFDVPNWVPMMGGKSWSVPDIPYAQFASGGIANSPTFGLFGEAGQEALVPLDRPLNQVDPSVRWLSAIAQGKVGNTSNRSASVVINTPATDPRLIASILEDSIFDGWR